MAARVGVMAILSALGVWWLLDREPGGAPERTVRVGYSPEPPFSFRTTQGLASGEEPEVARVVLARAGFRHVEWVQTDFGLLIPELLSGRIDMIAAGMFVTPERAGVVSFSRPTLALSQSLLVLRGNPKKLHRYDDFSRGDGRLCVLKGAVEYRVALTLGVPESRLMAAPDANTCMVALESGNADGLALSRASIRQLAGSAGPAVEVATPFHEPLVNGAPMKNLAAFAFRRADTELRSLVDAQLTRFLGTAEHLELIGRFQFGPYDLPGAIPVRERTK